MTKSGTNGRRLKKALADEAMAKAATVSRHSNDADTTEFSPLGREALDVAASWAIIVMA